ncbi:MAG: thioredoxin-disulfide reductase [Hydrogenobacter thermophilus]|uniref:thioredoxin-disulfide reductase n=1 Tax=Hydrogenobacter thermophilus TaxID=940 RepID=UPI001C778F1B|nr:thioredoxin-disulfide reductase [Hydrogenobacter thermophilus]QWK19620.1 MAG: thioredoxin-disulfide reductase [Hydrogenobacter thermophilus]
MVEVSEDILYDCIIIGGGPAGLTAGLYTARAKLNTLLLEKGTIGGQIAIADLVENYPGFPEGISGKELSLRFKQQAERFGLKVAKAEATKIEKSGKEVFVHLRDGRVLRAKTLIVASGSNPRKLGVPGEDKFLNRGVSYCATCDGALFDGSPIAVIGGGDSATQEALFLTRFGSVVYLIHRRDQLRAQKHLQEKVFSNPKIKFIPDTVVEEISGNEFVEKLILKNTKSGEVSELEVEGVFIFIGLEPNTGFLKDSLKLDEKGYIITDESLRTSLEGVFAAGDCRSGSTGQVAVAVGEGCIAGIQAEKYIEHHF